jgi:hypothetical protein
MPEGGADDYADRGFRSRGGHSRGRDGGYPFRGGEDGEGPADGQYQDYPEDDSQYPQQASGPQGIPSYSPAPAQDDEVFMGTFQKITPDGHRVLVHRNANADGPGMVTEIGPDGRKYRRVMSSSPAD